MIWFVGAGSGDPELITVKGQRLLRQADQIIYAGSLVNPALLRETKAGAQVRNSAEMTLEEVIFAMEAAEAKVQMTVRLHTGDPSLYGAIREQMDRLEERGIAYEMIPGVSSFSAAAAALQREYTLPGISQTLILTRMAGRTPVPEAEGIASLAAHGASMAIFLSASMLEELQEKLLRGAYREDTPAVLAYKVSWPDEKLLPCTVGSLAQTGREYGISKTALVLVGDFLDGDYQRSLLYHPEFSTEYRQAKEQT